MGIDSRYGEPVLAGVFKTGTTRGDLKWTEYSLKPIVGYFSSRVFMDASRLGTWDYFEARPLLDVPYKAFELSTENLRDFVRRYVHKSFERRGEKKVFERY